MKKTHEARVTPFSPSASREERPRRAPPSLSGGRAVSFLGPDRRDLGVDWSLPRQEPVGPPVRGVRAVWYGIGYHATVAEEV